MPNPRAFALDQVVKRARKAIELYKRPAEQARVARELVRDVAAVLAPYTAGNADGGTLTQCNGAAYTPAGRTGTLRHAIEQRAATQGGRGVALRDEREKANSFSPSGTNTQCSQSDYTIVPIQPAVTLAGVLAKYAKPPVGVVEIGHEKAPEPEEARGAEVAAEWPSECEVLVTGVCPNPRLMAGEIWAGGRKTGRKVSLWKTWKGERAGVVVRARLERGSGREALYAVVYPEKTVVVPAAAGA